MQGTFIGELADLLKADGKEVHGVAQEFGTKALKKVGIALIQENFEKFKGEEPLTPESKASQRLLEVFAPKKEAWRAEVVERGLGLFQAGLKKLESLE